VCHEIEILTSLILNLLPLQTPILYFPPLRHHAAQGNRRDDGENHGKRLKELHLVQTSEGDNEENEREQRGVVA
jgi:hypothetical protein